jgi:hypothetical protein
MSLYRCTIARDGTKRQIIVHWDDNDPNRHIVAPQTVPADELDEARLAQVVGSMGFPHRLGVFGQHRAWMGDRGPQQQ